MNKPRAKKPKNPVQAIVVRLMGKLSQGEIARRTQVPQTRLSRWAHGIQIPIGATDVIKLLELEAQLEALAPTEEIRP